MTRYVAMKAVPRAYWEAIDLPEQPRTMTAIEELAEPQHTGLFDAHGTPIYRLPDAKRIGY